MTDQERELRAHLHAADLPDAPIALTSVLRTIADGDPTTARRRRPGGTAFLLVAAALAVLGGAAVAGGGLVMPPAPPTMSPLPAASSAIVAPSPTPGGSAAPVDADGILLPSPSGPCPTETARILTGDDMPPVRAVPGTIAATRSVRGAYLTSPDGEPVPADIWAARDGSFARIAVVTGSMNMVKVADVSRDGRWITVAMGRISGGGHNTQCMDLYVLSADGSQVEQLTHNRDWGMAGSGEFSADGRYVAFTSSTPPAENSVAIWDRVTGTITGHPCAAGYGAQLAWSRSAARLAVLCGPDVLVLDAETGEVGTTAIGASSPWGIAWAGDHEVLLATDPEGRSPDMTVQTLDLSGNSLSGTLLAPERVGLNGEPVSFGIYGVRPGGSGQLAADPGGTALLIPVDTAPAEAWGTGLDLASPGSATAVSIAESGVIDAAWTDEGDGIVLLSVVEGAWHLEVRDPATGTMFPLATLPDAARTPVLRLADIR